MKPKTKTCTCGRIVYATPCYSCKEVNRRAKDVSKTRTIQRLTRQFEAMKAELKEESTKVEIWKSAADRLTKILNQR